MTVKEPKALAGIARSVAAAGLACALACGEVRSGEDGGTPIDAADDPAIDAIPSRCDPASDFGPPVELANVNAGPMVNDEAAALSADERTIYFSSDRDGNAGMYDLFFATRDDPDGEFSDPEPIPFVNAPTRMERRPVISVDGLQLFAQVGPNTDLDIWFATRANTNQPFDELVPAPVLNEDGKNDYTPYTVGTQNSVYFASNRDNTASSTADIWRAEWNGTTFDTPSKVAGVDLASDQEESNPVVTPDELTLFFASNRVGELEIYMVTRVSADDDFGPAVHLAALSSVGLDAPNWVSADGCVLYLTQRVGPSNQYYKIFVAKRSP